MKQSTSPRRKARGRQRSTTEPYVFVSYARADELYAERLVEYLQSNGIPAWFDRLLRYGARWPQELATHVERAAALVVVDSPNVSTSDWVYEEFIHARREDVPILVLALGESLSFGFQTINSEYVTGGALPSQRFITQLREILARTSISVGGACSYVSAALAPSTPRPSASVPGGAWQFPGQLRGTVERPSAVNQIVNALRSSAVTVTGTYGAGGLGKTVLARMVCAREDVRAAFPGGLLWVDLGKERRGAALAEVIISLCARIGSSLSGVLNASEAGRELCALLARRPPTLVVLDDAWFDDQIRPFLDYDAGATRFLITTRVTSLMPTDAVAIRLDQLDAQQARSLLLRDLPPLPEDTVVRLLDLTGGWPLVVKSANAMLRRAARERPDVGPFAAWLVNALESDGVGTLDLGNMSARERTFTGVMGRSLDLLSEGQRRRAAELSIFAEDTDIDLSLVELLWRRTGGLTASDTRELVFALWDLNVLGDFRPEAGSLRIHDLVRSYLANQLDQSATRSTHAALVEAAASHFGLSAETETVRPWWRLPTSAEYMWRHIVRHLVAAGLQPEADELLTDLRWTQARLLRNEAVALDSDLGHSESPTVLALRQTLQREAHLLGPITPAHSYTDLLTARLRAVPDLQAAVERYLQAVPAGPVRIFPTWPLPDTAHTATRRVLTGHSKAAVAVAVAPRGAWIVSSSWDGSVRIWDAVSGRERAKLLEHDAIVTAVAIAPDESWIATGGEDGTVRIWDVATGTQRLSIRSHDDHVTAIAIAPDGSWLVAGGGDLGAVRADYSIRLLDVSTGKQRAVLTGHADSVLAVQVAPDGSWIASASADWTVRIWDVNSGKEAATLETNDQVHALAIAPDGRWFVTAGSDPTLRVWDKESGTQTMTMVGHADRVSGLAIAPNGTWLVSASADRTVRMWDAHTGETRAVYYGHTGTVAAVAIAADDSWIASASWDGTVRLWDVTDPTPHAANSSTYGALADVAIAPDGGWVVTAGDDGVARLWDTHSGTELTRLVHSSKVLAVAPAPDGSWLATLCADGVTEIGDLYLEHAGDLDKAVRLWNVRTGQLIAAPTSKLSNAMGDIAISPDGSWLAATTDAGNVQLWDSAGTHLGTLKHEMPVTGVAIAPDGAWLATISLPINGNQPVRLWNTSTCTVRSFVELDGHATDIAIAPDGSWIAVASWLGGVHILDATSGTERGQLSGHDGSVTAVAISPDGGRVATTGVDQTVRIWDVVTGTNVATTRVAGPLAGVCWAPDGQTVFAAGQFGLYRFEVSDVAFQVHGASGGEAR